MEIFRTLIEQPIFNLLEIIYALVPGHDLGVAIIIFTAIIRLALWPLVRKQLHHSRRIRALQPELKKIKKAAKGDRQKEARLQMELYKEHEIKPLASFGTILIQIPIFIGLYQAVSKLINDPQTLQTYSYEWVRNLPWIKDIAANGEDFSTMFLGLVDLAEKGLQAGGGLYLPAIILAAVASVVQYYQSRHLLMDQQDSRKLSEILKEAASGKETDQAEVTAAVSKGMLYFMPIVTFLFAINLPAALSLYFLTSSAVGLLQQKIILREDIEEMSKVARQKTIPAEELAAEAEETPAETVAANKKPKKKKTSKSKKKRR